MKAETREFARSIADTARTAAERGNYYCYIRLGRHYMNEALYRSDELQELYGTGDAWVSALNADQHHKTVLENRKKCFSRWRSC